MQQKISHLVEQHFPAFYKSEGPNFIAFLQAYYEWVEQEQQVIGKSRNLLNNFDVDRSVDEFVTNFKQKYLANFPLLAETDQRTFVKKASEIYRSKGSQRAIELLFRLLFNEDIAVYYPTVDVLRPSDGKWTVPVYLELSEAEKTHLFIGNLVTGQRSRATAVVSRVAKRTLAGKTFDVAYLTNITGEFQLNEIVTFDGIIDGSPTVIGSLNSIIIDNAGQNFEVGDVVDVISSATGRQATARVANTAPATGKIEYIIEDGGAGYSINSTVIVSEKVLTYTGFRAEDPYTKEFQQDETVTQTLTYVPFITSTGAYSNNAWVYGLDASVNPATKVAFGRVVSYAQNTISGTGNLVINSSTSATIDIDTIVNPSATGSFTVGETVFQYEVNTSHRKTIGTVLAANSSQTVIDLSLGSIVDGETLIGATSNCYANVAAHVLISGSFTNTTISTIAQYYGPVSPTALVVSAGVQDRTVTAKVVDSNTTHIGVYQIDASRTFDGGLGAWFVGSSSGARANIMTVSAGDVGGFDVGSLTDEEQVIVYPDIIDSLNAANVNFLSIAIDGNGIGSNVGFLDSVTVVDGGSGYTNSSTVTISGGSPSVLATATVNTHANGTIRDIVVTNIGGGYDSAPSISVADGTGANLQAVIDPGYGFVKNINGDLYSIIDTCLRKQTANVGTIASLTNIDPGSNNTASPFVRVVNYDIAGFGRKHFTVNITGNTKPFIIGENITQEVYDPIVTINATGMSGAFNAAQRETVTQRRADGNTVFGELITATFVPASNTGVLRIRVADVANTFDTSNTIIGLTSNSSANVASKTSTTVLQLAKGRVIANTATSIDVFRTRFSVSFGAGSVIFGATSGAQATIRSLVEIDDSPVFGSSAVINSPAQSANGTISKVDVLNSGFGYTNGEIITMRAADRPYIATGIARLYKQGTGEGYWSDTASFISADKVVQDSDFYQDFSYQIESTLSLERYADVVKDTVHLAGTKTFGRINRAGDLNIDLDTEDLSDRNAVLTISGGNNGELQQYEEIAQYDGTTKVANGYIENVRVAVTVEGANTEFIPGGQVSRPTFFANTSYGVIESTYSDYNANTTTIYLTDVRGLFQNGGQIQTEFDRIQLTYDLTSFINGNEPVNFAYPEVVYQSNGTANVGVGNITSANATHLIIKPATKLFVGTRTGTLAPGDTIFQRANTTAPNTAVGIVGLSNSTVIEVVDPRGQFEPGQKVFTSNGNAQVISVGGKSDNFTKSNTVIMRISNLTDVGFMDSEVITQPATGAYGTLSIGNTSYISVNDVSGTFNAINPIVGQASGVQADVTLIEGPFAIIGATSGANAEIIAIQEDRVLTTLAVNSSIGAINTLTVANVAGQFTYGGVIVGANSSTNATITSVEIQAY